MFSIKMDTFTVLKPQGGMSPVIGDQKIGGFGSLQAGFVENKVL